MHDNWNIQCLIGPNHTRTTNQTFVKRWGPNFEPEEGHWESSIVEFGYLWKSQLLRGNNVKYAKLIFASYFIETFYSIMMIFKTNISLIFFVLHRNIDLNLNTVSLLYLFTHNSHMHVRLTKLVYVAICSNSSSNAPLAILELINLNLRIIL